MLSKLDDEAVRAEMESSRAVIEAALGVRPAASGLSGRRPHLGRGPREFAIAAELGFKTAVTTRPGVVFRRARRASDRAAAHFAQRRISSSPRYAKVLMSGAATALWNGFRPRSTSA